MLRDLPEPKHNVLPRAPVELVVWQLQFAEPADVVPPTVGTQLAERLASDGSGAFQLQRLTQQTFAFAFQSGSPQGPPPSEQSLIDGWTLRRGSLTVTLSRQALAVETNIYPGWSALRNVIDLAVGGLADAVLLPGEQRLGLRYVDRITHPAVKKPQDWSNLLAPWLASPLSHQQLGDSVTAYAQQVDFEADPEGLRATLRQRLFPDPQARGQQTVMLDFDIFREGYRLIEPDVILQTTAAMNDMAHRLFEASISDMLYEAFASNPEDS